MKRRRAAGSNHLPLTNVHTTWGRLEKPGGGCGPDPRSDFTLLLLLPAMSIRKCFCSSHWTDGCEGRHVEPNSITTPFHVATKLGTAGMLLGGICTGAPAGNARIMAWNKHWHLS